MNEPNVEKLKEDGWNNCKKCGWFYNQRVLDQCPMCRHEWRRPVGYNQPQYEAPTIE